MRAWAGLATPPAVLPKMGPRPKPRVLASSVPDDTLVRQSYRNGGPMAANGWGDGAAGRASGLWRPPARSKGPDAGEGGKAAIKLAWQQQANGSALHQEEHKQRKSGGLRRAAIAAGPCGKRSGAAASQRGQRPGESMGKGAHGKELGVGRGFGWSAKGGRRSGQPCTAGMGWAESHPWGRRRAAGCRPLEQSECGACRAHCLLSQSGCAAPLLLLPPPTDLRGLSKACGAQDGRRFRVGARRFPEISPTVPRPCSALHAQPLRRPACP